MSKQLPRPTASGAMTARYGQQLVREIEILLRGKADLVEGKLYASKEQPLVFLDPATGEERSPLFDSDLTDNGGTILTEEDLVENGGTVAQKYMSGMTVQHAFVSTGSAASTSVAIPYDDSIPQITEGGQALVAGFVPKRSDSRIRIRTVLQLRLGNGGSAIVLTAAIFRQGVSNALGVGSYYPAGGLAFSPVTAVADIPSPGTSYQVFSVRAGAESNNPIHMNADETGHRIFGGAYASTLEITEYMP